MEWHLPPRSSSSASAESSTSKQKGKSNQVFYFQVCETQIAKSELSYHPAVAWMRFLAAGAWEHSHGQSHIPELVPRS